MERDGQVSRRCLEELPSLRSLGEEDVGSLIRLCTPVHHQRERVLAYQGEKLDRAFLVVAGAVRLLKYRSDDTCVVLGEVQPGEWVGLTEAVLSCPSLVDASALPGSDVLAYSQASLRSLRKSPAIQDHLLACLARASYGLHLRIEDNLPLPRLVRFLLEHAIRKEKKGILEVTQDQIAEAIGVTRETVNRYLQRLQGDGVVRLGRGAIEVVDPDELEERLLL